MYITSISLKNIKCFKDLSYEFEHTNGASLVIAGDNGDGKSTILQSIAISLCDQWSATGLLRELSGDFTRDGSLEDGLISLSLISDKKKYEIKTYIKWNSERTYEYPSREIHQIYKNGKSKKLEETDFEWKKIFATGYGSGLRTVGTQDFQDYFTGDSIYSLFKHDIPLQNPELAVRRIFTSMAEQSTAVGSQEQVSDAQKKLLTWIKDILRLKENESLEILGNGIFICEQDNSRSNIHIPLAAAADGYKSLTALILDMLSWWLLYNFDDTKSDAGSQGTMTLDSLKKMNGIVIIDEMEQHLHPKWQSEILPSLKEHFPAVQFIVATHSPLVLSSSQSEILMLGSGIGIKGKLYGWLAEDVYTEMGKEKTRASEIETKIRKFDSLYKKKLEDTIDEQEKKDFEQLYEQLKIELPSHDPVLETMKLDAMRSFLQEG